VNFAVHVEYRKKCAEITGAVLVRFSQTTLCQCALIGQLDFGGPRSGTIGGVDFSCDVGNSKMRDF
jgi:hypothetical protein